ncbi:polysaccharide deacetylase family protein [Pleurocapsales cyanobacterium LEGE 10410]|nr:polysaccharide deacetylase family protein [Pleurocapsales cyanobacterium LEGE 10410]
MLLYGNYIFLSFLGLFFFLWYVINTIAKTSKFQIIGEYFTHFQVKEKAIALTYDDGPNPPYTEELLNVLAEFNAKATFFVVGENVKQYPETIKLIQAQGHEIGNHSYSHSQLVFKTPAFVKSEIEKTDQLLSELGVEKEINFRAPFGYKLAILPYILAKMKKKSILWNVDPRDYALSDPNKIQNYILNLIKPGSIVLLHDGGENCSSTIIATKGLLQELQGQGYQFKTVSEMLLLQNN